MTEPFGRQPKPVTITIEGEREDVAYWTSILARRAEFKGDLIQLGPQGFKIYPRAVND